MLRLVALLLAALSVVPPAASVEDMKSPADLLHWSAPTLLVSDLDRSASWYQAHLGFGRVADRLDGTSRSIVLARGPALVHLRAQSAETIGGVEASTGLAGRRRLTLLVADVDTLVADLREQGLEIVAVPQDDDGRHRSAMIADPDGNPILLTEPLQPGD